MTAMKFMMVVSDPQIAAYAVAHGLDRLFVDLERLGKADRQGHLDTWKSQADPHDITRVREAAPGADLMVRLNPMHDGTRAEVEDALARGADVLMLPMFRDAATLARFADMVRGRAALMPLVETAPALAALPEILAKVAPEAVHIGINDLHLDLGQRFMFQPLADGLLDPAAACLRAAGVPFGIGGIARAGTGAVPAEQVLGEHARLGSEWVIVSRGFHGRATCLADITQGMDFAGELARLRAIHAGHLAAGATALAANRRAFVASVGAVVAAAPDAPA